MTPADRHVPEATVARLPLYLRSLQSDEAQSSPYVSSDVLARLSGVNAAQVRKDLSHLGTLGTRGVGYDVDHLVQRIRKELGLSEDHPLVVVGVGNLGRALVGFRGFPARGFRVVGLYDDDPAKIGTAIGGVEIRPVVELGTTGQQIEVGIICTPGEVAQECADRLVAAGVVSILSFAPVNLHVPTGVNLRKVDLSLELQILSFYSHRAGSEGDDPGAGAGPGIPVETHAGRQPAPNHARNRVPAVPSPEPGARK